VRKYYTAIVLLYIVTYDFLNYNLNHVLELELGFVARGILLMILCQVYMYRVEESTVDVGLQ
jgi:hypothetical protein